MVDQIIRPSALPRRTNPVASEIVPVDNGTSVAGSTLAEIVNAGRPLASRAEAEAGANAEKAMTPLTVDQKIEYEIGRSLASKAQGDKADSAIQEIVEGANTTVDNTDPQRPIISSSGNPSAGFKTDIVVVDGQTDWRFARNYKTVSDLLADDGSGDMGMGYSGSGANVVVSPGDIVTAQGFRYEVAASGATDAHVETAGGVKLYVLAGDQGFSVAAFGDMSTDAYDAFSKAPDGAYVEPGTYPLSQSIFNKSFWSTGPVQFNGAGRALVVDVLHEFNAGFAAVENGPYNSGGTDIYYAAEPRLVVTKSGRIFVFYSMAASHTGTNVTGPILMREYQRATGIWGARQVVASRTGFQSRNLVAGSTQTGRIWLAYFECERDASGTLLPGTFSTIYKYSDDDCQTWSADSRLDLYMDYPSTTGQTVIPFGKLVNLSNGDLLVTVYRFRVVMTLRSTDNGETWGVPYAGGPIPHPNPNRAELFVGSNWSDDNITEPTILQIDSNRLIALCRCIPSGVMQNGTARLKYLGNKWAATTRYELGMFSYVDGVGVYECTVAGTSGSTAPSHTSGTAVDGTVTWTYRGSSTNFVGTTAVTLGQYIVTYSNYLYEVVFAGTTDTTAGTPYLKFEGNETQLAVVRSENGGASWGAPIKITWTNATYRATTSPPSGTVKGGMVDIMWYARSPDYTLYHVRMSAIAFFYRPEWVFSITEGNPKSKAFRSFIASQGDAAYGWRVDVGYVDLAYLPWADDQIMYSWYDKPAVGVAGRTTIYSNILKT